MVVVNNVKKANYLKEMYDAEYDIAIFQYGKTFTDTDSFVNIFRDD